MPATPNDKPKHRLCKRPYVEIGDNSDKEDNADKEGSDSPGSATGSPGSAKGKPGSMHNLAGKGRIKADPSSPVAQMDDRPTFLHSLSTDPCYIRLLDKLSCLPIYVSSIHS